MSFDGCIEARYGPEGVIHVPLSPNKVEPSLTAKRSEGPPYQNAGLSHYSPPPPNHGNYTIMGGGL